MTSLVVTFLLVTFPDATSLDSSFPDSSFPDAQVVAAAARRPPDRCQTQAGAQRAASLNQLAWDDAAHKQTCPPAVAEESETASSSLPV
jgi:hypothetical protein